jgi:hypothetical protein
MGRAPSYASEAGMSWLIILLLVTGEVIWQPSSESECNYVAHAHQDGAHISAGLPSGKTIEVSKVMCMSREVLAAGV